MGEVRLRDIVIGTVLCLVVLVVAEILTAIVGPSVFQTTATIATPLKVFVVLVDGVVVAVLLSALWAIVVRLLVCSRCRAN